MSSSIYYILGSTPRFTTKADAPTNHSDRFDIDEAVLPIGVKAHVLTALAFLSAGLPSINSHVSAILKRD